MITPASPRGRLSGSDGSIRYEQELTNILKADSLRWEILGLVRTLKLSDCWVGAGFIRNSVWDHLHGRRATEPADDVDVIWFNQRQFDKRDDRKMEAQLHALLPEINWSVKNQARMHIRNGDAPYASALDAMRFWPETATAEAARRDDSDGIDIAAPFGLDDLFGLKLKPTPNFVSFKRNVFDSRVNSKGWLKTYPLLQT
jgi:uncharacterized protein